MIDALKTLAAGESLPRKVIATRYTTGLPRVDAERRHQLLPAIPREVRGPCGVLNLPGISVVATLPVVIGELPRLETPLR